MKRIAFVASAAVAPAAAAALLVGGTTASAAGGSHTLKLNATVLKTIEPNKSTSVETDALTSAGKKVGYETQSCNDGGQGLVCSVSFALKNGMLLGTTRSPITTASHATFKGKITGGLGRFTGDKGSIRGTVDGIHAHMTLTYKS